MALEAPIYSGMGQFLVQKRHYDHDECLLTPLCQGQFWVPLRGGINIATQTDKEQRNLNSAGEYLDDEDDDDRDDIDYVGPDGKKRKRRGNKRDEVQNETEVEENINNASSSQSHKTPKIIVSEDEEDFDDDDYSFDEDFYDDDISAKRRKLGSMGLEKELRESDQMGDAVEETKTVIKGIHRSTH